MKKRYVLAIALAACLRVQSKAQDIPSGGFGPPQVIVEPDVVSPTSAYTTDLDGDGDQDVVVASAGDNRIIWYANDGQGNFGRPLVLAADTNGAVSVFGSDLDSDGDQDILATSRSSETEVTWYENNGQGNFSRPQTIATSERTLQDIAVGDLDGDGDLDVLFADESFRQSEVFWYQNNGQGNFEKQSTIDFREGDDFRAVDIMDLDEDGDQDIVATSTGYGNKVVWYENNGQGGFGKQQEVASQLGINNSVSSVDLDGDGDQDILSTLTSSYDEIVWYENNGQGNFSEQQVLATERGIRSVSARDLDGDSDLDLLFSISDYPERVVWYENTGQTSFGDPQVITTEVDRSIVAKVADLDGDGDLDVLSASDAFRYSKVAWYTNDGHGSFGEQRAIAQPSVRLSETATTLTDFDGDGSQDIIAKVNNSNIVWYQNDGQGNFGQFQTLIDARTAIGGFYLVDLSGDGVLDILTPPYSSNTGKVLWYKNDGQGGFDQPRFITDSSVSGAYIADIDGDGDQDVVLTAGSGKISWYPNDGQGNFGEPQPVNTTETTEGRFAYPADLDADGDQDVLIVSAYSSNYDNTIYWCENDGQGNFGEQQSIATVRGLILTPSIADLDEDGDQDVLFNAYSQSSRTPIRNRLFWYRNDGQNNFRSRQEIPTPDTNELGYAADLDGDGDQDIISSSSEAENGNATWYENNGRGDFSSEPRSITKWAGYVHVADLDGDAVPDILFSTDERLVWHKNLLSDQPSSPSVTDLMLYNARTDAKIEALEDENSIDLLSLDLRDYNIRANIVAAGKAITRVKFDLIAPARQDTTTIELKPPYTLYGDKPNGDFRRRKSYAGDYQLTVTPYYQEGDNEVAGVSKTVDFTFVARGLRARNLRMVDTRDNSLIESLEDGDVITLARDQRISILADSRYPQYNSMEFFLDGPNPDGIDEVRALENLAPFAIFGDDGLNTDPNGNPLAAGEYELRVIPYQGKNRASYAGPEEVVRFTVVRPTITRQELAYPVPFTNEVSLRTESGDTKNLRIQFVHSYGQVYEVSPSQVTATKDGLRIDVAALPAGPYTIQLQQADQVKTFRGSKE